MKIGKEPGDAWLSPGDLSPDLYQPGQGAPISIIEQVFKELDTGGTTVKVAIEKVLASISDGFYETHQSPLGYVWEKPGSFWPAGSGKCPLEECVNYSLVAPGNITRVWYNDAANDVCILSGAWVTPAPTPHVKLRSTERVKGGVPVLRARQQCRGASHPPGVRGVITSRRRG